MSILASQHHRAETPPSRAVLLRVCSLLLVLFVGLWTAAQVPDVPADHAPALAYSQAAADRTARYEAPDNADVRLKLKALVTCEWSEGRPDTWQPGRCLISGDFSAYAGTRGSARIPADRIRRTAVPLGHSFFHRGPPLSA
jgi:hypothetical protein